MIIQSKRIWILEQWAQAQLELGNGKIQAILPYETKPADIDYGNQRIYPGFIDTHCHGSFGFDTNDAQSEGLKEWLRKAPAEGLTALCPTTITQSEEVLTRALQNVALVAKENPNGAQIVGIHFEGPYLSLKYKGAQPPAYIMKPDLQQFARYQKAADNLIKIVTMAAEEDNDYEFIRAVSATGVNINLGHSASTYQQAFFGFANGAKGTTHTFNGMTPLNHREPGLAGAALHLSSTYSELICDGIHVVWPVVQLLFGAKGKDRVILVTDALCAKGIGEGEYVFGGQKITIGSNGAAFLSEGNSLAGSTLLFNHALRNAVEFARVDEVSAINAGTVNPARVLGINKQKGLLLAGYDADLTILDDDYDVQATYVLGEKVYEKRL